MCSVAQLTKTPLLVVSQGFALTPLIVQREDVCIGLQRMSAIDQHQLLLLTLQEMTDGHSYQERVEEHSRVITGIIQSG